MNVFNDFKYNGKKQIPQYRIFRGGMTQLNSSLKKLGRTFKLQKELLKTEMNHDEKDANIWNIKKMNGWIMLNKLYCVLLSHMLDVVRQWKFSLVLVWKIV